MSNDCVMFVRIHSSDTGGGQLMKKIVIACVGLLLLVTYGCSGEDTKEPAGKTKEAVIEVKDKAVEMSSETATSTKEAAIEVKDKAAEMVSDAATSTKEAAIEIKDKTVEMGSDAVKATKKKPAIEGC
jgi:hypothetical protein